MGEIVFSFDVTYLIELCKYLNLYLLSKNVSENSAIDDKKKSTFTALCMEQMVYAAAKNMFHNWPGIFIFNNQEKVLILGQIEINIESKITWYIILLLT